MVRGFSEHAPPARWTGADFEEQKQRSALRLEEDWVPAGISLAVRLNAVADGFGFGPAAFGKFGVWSLGFEVAGGPDFDVRILFIGSAEPRGDEPFRCFSDCRGVAGGE